MDRKRAVVTAVISPERKKRGTEKEVREQNDNDKVNGDDYDGIIAAAVADQPAEAATSPHVPVTADTVMRFPKYPKATNREIMTQHVDFVRWAKAKNDKGAAHGRLREFVDWAESPEGRGIEHRFTFGQHRGQTFADVARHDPAYHVRYMRILRRNNESPHEELATYMSWLETTTGGGPGGVRDSSLMSTGGDGTDNVHSPSSSASADVLPPTSPAVPIAPNAAVISSESPPPDELAAYVGWLDNGQQRFTLGRHKGRTFREVAVEDPTYGTVPVVGKHDSK
jgi:hypothetical protein